MSVQISEGAPPADRFIAAAAGAASPLLLLDIDVVAARYGALRDCLPEARVFYAVKANPHPEVLRRLSGLGCGFDIASVGELQECRVLGVAAERLSYGNPMKKESDIATARAQGVDLFAVDSAMELEKLARAASGARVFCRLAVSGAGAEWPLTHKFGCTIDQAVELMCGARAMGLRPAGVSFHVGSQQTSPDAWSHAIRRAGEVFARARRAGVNLEFLNLGGGLPAHYTAPTAPLERYTDTIRAALGQTFGGAIPELFIEPGRYMVADAGALVTEVVLVADRPHEKVRRWVYLDAGLWSGLDETMDERIHFRLHVDGTGRPRVPVVLAGPTCDSADVMYRHGVELPLDLRAGERVIFLSAGAYTASCSTVGFNGFPPLEVQIV